MLASAFAAAPAERALLLSTMGLALVAAALCDGKVRRLPDPMTAVVALAAAALAALNSTATIVMAGVSAFLTLIVLECVRRGFLFYKGKPGIGLGDVKLLTALALWLGPHTPWVIAGAAMLALPAGVLRRPADDRQAFGPYIAVAAWTIGMAGETGLWPIPR